MLMVPSRCGRPRVELGCVSHCLQRESVIHHGVRIVDAIRRFINLPLFRSLRPCMLVVPSGCGGSRVKLRGVPHSLQRKSVIHHGVRIVDSYSATAADGVGDII